MVSSLVERVRARIQDPRLTTSMCVFSPRKHALYPPVSKEAVDAAEAELGFSLPSLLRELYMQVGNGGFGPGYGIFGLAGGYVDALIIELGYNQPHQGGTLVDWYFAYRGRMGSMPELNFPFDFAEGSTLLIDQEGAPDSWSWFDKLLPIAQHGCWQISCIDCAKANSPVLFLEGQQSAMWLESRSFDEWIDNWMQP